MATTPEGQQLTEQHRLDQVAIKAAFLAQFAQMWPLLSWTALDATFVAWVHTVMPILRTFRQRSARRSERYFHEFRAIEAPARVRLNPPAPIRYLNAQPDHFDIDLVRDIRNAEPDRDVVTPSIDWAPFDKAAERSLLITGPGQLKHQASMGRTEEQAKDRGLVVASGSASRHMLVGGREVQMELIDSDDAILGYIRVTDGDPCSFCALLASRGPVYKQKSFLNADSKFAKHPKFAGISREEAKVHDNCACQLEPVYVKAGNTWPGRSREFRRLYNDKVAGKYSSHDLRRAFRREYEARQREAATQSQPKTA